MDQSKNKNLITIVFAIVIAVLAFGLVVGLSVSLRNRSTPLNTVETDKITDEEGIVLNDGEIHSMPVRMLFAPKATLLGAVSGESQPMTARISASVTPSNAKYQDADWALAFVNSESNWASGKNISDYVTVTPDADGSLVATITCLQPFGEQITLTATSRDNPDASISCLLDYKQQYQGFDLSLEQVGQTPSVNNSTMRGTLYADFENEEPLIIRYSYKKSDVYTVELADSEIVAPTLTVAYKDALTNALNNVKSGAGTAPSAIADGMSFSLHLFDKNFIEGFSASQTNNAISAIDTNKSNGVLFNFYDEGGNLAVTYTFTIGTTAIKNEMRVVSMSIDKPQIIFGEEETEYTITYRRAGAANNALTLFEKGSEYGLSKLANGFYPETYKTGETVKVSNLKTTFYCSGPGGDYHSGSGGGNASYKFSGWYWDSEKTMPFDGTIPAGMTGDITLYADITATSTHYY